MSIALMTLAFKCEAPATQKLVLLALCDSANDQGECYPSISTLAEKCSLSERAVQEAINRLEECGGLHRDFRAGRSTVYWMTPADYAPRTKCTPHLVHHTPAADAPPPPQDVHHTPADCAPITVTESSIEPSRKRAEPGAKRSAPEPAMVDWDDSKAKGVIPLPADWELPEAWGLDGEALGWKVRDILNQSVKFRIYWTKGNGAGRRKSVRGWRQSWTNWLSKAERMAA